MSGHQVLAQASDALRAMLLAALAKAELAPVNPDNHEISFAPPFLKKGELGPEKLLYVWLYFVTENEHAKNRPPTVSAGMIQPPPLSLTLYYLITPGLSAPADDVAADGAVAKAAEVLGAVLQGIHNQPVIPINIAEGTQVTGAAEELHLSLCKLSLEELTRIWEALDYPYRLSVCVKASIVRIDSGRATKGPPVVSREFVSGRLQRQARPR